MHDNCIFCKIISGEIPSTTIYENSEFKVILDRFPASKGHVLILPKEHIQDIYGMDGELAGRLFALATRFAPILKRTFCNDGLNIVQNNGKAAGQAVFHYHLHMIPRYEGDGMELGWKPDEVVTVEELKEYMNQIKANM